jgi:hypothetical protein
MGKAAAIDVNGEGPLGMFVREMRRGAFDDQLEALNSEIVARIKTWREIKANKAALAVYEGAAVELHGLSPKYLNGLKGVVKVKERSGKTVSVELDKKSGDLFYRRGFLFGEAAPHAQIVRVPARCCKVV